MTRTRIDLVLRGLIRGFSVDMRKCHSCFRYYDNIHYAVSNIEELYIEWNEPTTSSYKIFQKIT